MRRPTYLSLMESNPNCPDCIGTLDAATDEHPYWWCDSCQSGRLFV